MGRLICGDVNIVIGTPRLVSNEVQFNDLRLVVIDEEQCFGVRAKEYLKHLRKRSVARLQGKKVPPLIDASVDLDFLDRSPSQNDVESRLTIVHLDLPSSDARSTFSKHWNRRRDIMDTSPCSQRLPVLGKRFFSPARQPSQAQADSNSARLFFAFVRSRTEGEVIF